VSTALDPSQTTLSRALEPAEAGEPDSRVDPLRDSLSDALAAEDADAVQLAGGGQRATSVKSLASQGVKGSSGTLPYLSRIQESFGHHDVSGVKAFTDDKARAANAAMGSNAYASGDKVAFGDAGLNLHTAAHEATHIIQQGAGIKPPGGVGSPGDPLEQQADAVADEVVQGKSAAGLLDSFLGKG